MQKTLHSQIAGGIVIGKNRKIVVVNQNGDSWSLPKGHVEPGESEKEAAIREIAEEAGITQLQYIKDLGSYERFKLARGGQGDDESELKKIKLFLFTTAQENLSPSDPSNPEARWVDIGEVRQLLSHPKDREFFEQMKPEIIDQAGQRQ